MPLTSSNKLEILQNLRHWFNSTDEYPAEPGRSLEFAEQVKSDVNEIYANELHKNSDGWGYRCGIARVENGYTFEEVFNLVCISGCHGNTSLYCFFIKRHRFIKKTPPKGVVNYVIYDKVNYKDFKLKIVLHNSVS